MNSFAFLSRSIDDTVFRLGDLAQRATDLPAAHRPLFEESLARLTTLLEELRATEAELLEQSEALKRSRELLELERRRADGTGGRSGWRESLMAAARAAGSPRSAARLAELLRDQVLEALYRSRVEAGDRMPSIREVARSTGLNHKVVARAYRALADEGVLDIRDRSGVYVARQEWEAEEALGELASWLAELLAQGWERGVAVPELPGLLRRWTATPLRCACVATSEEGCESLRAAVGERFGVRVTLLVLARSPGARRDEPELARRLAEVDLVVATPFHAGALRRLARRAGKPLLVATADPAAEPGTERPVLSARAARALSRVLVRLNQPAAS